VKGRKTAPAAAPPRLDAVIVGAGAAGLSAALFLRDFDLDAVLIEEGSRPGGQLNEIHAPIVNYLGTVGRRGEQVLDAALADARAAGLSILVGSPVTRISARSRWVERAADGAGGIERIQARALILASGLRRRSLGVPGEAELAGRGVSHSANLDRARFAGRPVVIVGGGTAAVEDAVLCAEVGSPVTLLHHSSHFRAREDFLARARAHPLVRFVVNASVTAIEGSEAVEGVRYRVGRGRGRAGRVGRGGREQRVECSGVFVRVGWEPRTELVRRQLRCDRGGFIRAGAAGATSAPWVFAAGDVCSPECPSVANAVGQGAAVAWEVGRRLGRVRG
jgi:thioredoxin reductase (NADPH)